MSHGATAAYRELHACIRDAWESAGISVEIDDGARNIGAGVTYVPVDVWYDAELANALKLWHSLRRRKKRQPDLRSDCQRVRRAYEKLKASKVRQWEKRWERFWVDVAKLDHLSVWKVMRALSGCQSLECTCGEPEQRQQYEKNGTIKNDPAFNSNKIAEAEVWLADFLERNLGSSAANGVAFTESDVRKAYKRLRQCASGIDGLSKKWIAPMVHLLIPQFTALFNYVYLEGTSVDDWTLGMVLSLSDRFSTR